MSLDEKFLLLQKWVRIKEDTSLALDGEETLSCFICANPFAPLYKMLNSNPLCLVCATAVQKLENLSKGYDVT